jgi:undecaprenyl-diphosphatase
MNIGQAVVLGLVQGLTEFLPISSSAHLVLFPWLLGWKDPGLAFDVFLHIGTLGAVAIYFSSDWIRILQAGITSIIERRIGWDRDRMLFWYLIFGTVPAAAAGFLFHDYFGATFRSPLLIAVALGFVGFLLFWIDGKFPALRPMEDMTLRDAVWIGMAQATALIPGVSRSGATMTMGRLLGLNREAAARFSFLLSVPIIVAAAAFELRNLLDQGSLGMPLSYLISGMVAAFITGILSIFFLINYLKSADFSLFAWYRIGLAAFIVLWSLFTGA